MIPFVRRLGFVTAPDLELSPERVNAEVQAQRRREYEGDVLYRQRVMQRMREGYRCQLPPLINAELYRQRRLVARVISWRKSGD